MSEISVYKWEDIRKYFPPERVAEIRAKILELRESGKYTDTGCLKTKLDSTIVIKSSTIRQICT